MSIFLFYISMLARRLSGLVLFKVQSRNRKQQRGGNYSDTYCHRFSKAAPASWFQASADGL
jgi:hypothetical protein